MKRLLIGFLVLVMLLSSAAMAESSNLIVRGTGVVSVTADCARIVLGVRESSSDVAVAQSTVNTKINAIVDALVAAEVPTKDIGTESLYIYANYDYSYGEEMMVGYTATNTISIFTTNMDRVGEYIDIAFAAGANTLDMVQFSAQSSEEAQKEALTLAVQNAFEKAEVIAAAAGMEIESVEYIDESSEYYGNNYGAKFSNYRAEGAVAEDASTMVQASSLQLEATVLVNFRVK